MIHDRIAHLTALGVPRRIASRISGEQHKGRMVFRAAEDNTAELLIYEYIGYDWWSDSGMDGKRFSEELTALGDISSLTVRINSPGGDVWDGMSIYNQLATFDAEVKVVVEGIAASAASLIAMAGDQVHAYENSQLMIHDAWTYVMGNEQELRDMADVLGKVDSQLAATYAGKSGSMSAEEFRTIMDKDTYLTASEAKEMGLVDEVITTTTKEKKAKSHMAARTKRRIDLLSTLTK